MAYIECKQIVRAYQVAGHEIVALRGIDFEMAKGEWVAIIGPSGAGKSSLLNLLGGLDRPTAGQLRVDDLNLLELKPHQLAVYRLRQVGFVWQDVTQNLLGHRSALRNVTLPMQLAGMPMWDRRERAQELLEAVGLNGHEPQRPAALSGGQQQRVAIAVALANRPRLLLADEPTGALDRKTAQQVMDLLHDLRGRFGLTILMVTHDLEVAAHADRVLTLRDGALGQDFSGAMEDALRFDDAGKIQLPEAVRSHLTHAPRIAVEVRPEGVLLRPEADDDDLEHIGLEIQDTPPEKKRGWLRRLRLKRRDAEGTEAQRF